MCLNMLLYRGSFFIFYLIRYSPTFSCKFSQKCQIMSSIAFYSRIKGSLFRLYTLSQGFFFLGEDAIHVYFFMNLLFLQPLFCYAFIQCFFQFKKYFLSRFYCDFSKMLQLILSYMYMKTVPKFNSLYKISNHKEHFFLII